MTNHNEETVERDGDSLLLSKPRHDNVGRCADQSPVAAEARAKSKRPHKRSHGNADIRIRRDRLDDGDHLRQSQERGVRAPHSGGAVVVDADTSTMVSQCSVVAEWAWMGVGRVRVSLCETTRESNTASRDAAVRVCPW
jgi:hypothetical protein